MTAPAVWSCDKCPASGMADTHLEAQINAAFHHIHDHDTRPLPSAIKAVRAAAEDLVDRQLAHHGPLHLQHRGYCEGVRDALAWVLGAGDVNLPDALDDCDACDDGRIRIGTRWVECGTCGGSGIA